MGEKHQKLKEKAARQADEGDLAGALEAYRRIVAEDETELMCWDRIGDLAKKLGDKPVALEAYRKVAARLAADGFLFKAIAALKEILLLDPGHTETEAAIARLYAQRKEAPRKEDRPSREPSRRSPSAQLKDFLVQKPRPSQLPGPAVPTLPKTPLFSDLREGPFKEMIARMVLRTFPAGAAIIQEGELGHSFFILSSGEVRVEKRGTQAEPMLLARLNEGAFFGEMALLQDGPRTASVIAETEAKVFELDKALLDDLVGQYPSVQKALRNFYQQRLLTTALATHPFFEPFTQAERERLATQFKGRAFSAGEVVIPEGKKGTGLFMLLTGRLEVAHGTGPAREVLAALGPGQLVGEMSLLDDRPTSAEVRTLVDSWVLRLAKADFAQIAGQRPEVIELLQRIKDARTSPSRPAVPALF
ncbi:MAG: cyclic nucleotide-binding domain-containing protein [Myxococcota bacterium]